MTCKMPVCLIFLLFFSVNHQATGEHIDRKEKEWNAQMLLYLIAHLQPQKQAVREHYFHLQGNLHNETGHCDH